MKPDSECKDEERFSRNRKFSKPMMERRRRARINDSLNELKTLVLSAMEKDPSRCNKMEKADILEITVNFLKGFCATGKNDIDHQAQFCAGYSECSREIQSYLVMANDVSPQVKATMLSRITLANPAAAVAHDKNAARLRLASSVEQTPVFGIGTPSSPMYTSSGLPLMPGGSSSMYLSPPASPASSSGSSSSSSAFEEVTRGKRKSRDGPSPPPPAKRQSVAASSACDSETEDSNKCLWRPW